MKVDYFGNAVFSNLQLEVGRKIKICNAEMFESLQGIKTFTVFCK